VFACNDTFEAVGVPPSQVAPTVSVGHGDEMYVSDIGMLPFKCSAVFSLLLEGGPYIIYVFLRFWKIFR